MGLRDDGTGWSLLSPPDCDCQNRDFTAIASDGAGIIYVGGGIFEFSMDGSYEATAFLLRYDSAARTWNEIDLPSPADLDQVNRILVTPAGDVFLACGEDKAALVRLPADGGFSIEWKDEGYRLYALTETSEGVLLAGGANVTGLAAQPVMLQRKE
jgi:hypothetical protein